MSAVLAVFATSRIFYLVSGFLLAKFVPTSSHQLTTTDVPPGSSIWPAAQNFADHLERANSFFNLAFLIFAVVVLLEGVRKLPSL